MTEPLLFALTTLVVAAADASGRRAPSCAVPPAAGWTIVAACLTRYEAWPIVGAAWSLAAFAQVAARRPLRRSIREIARLAAIRSATVIFFMGLSFASPGEWFVTGGFYVPDPKLQGQPRGRLREILEGLRDLGGLAVRAAPLSIAIALLALAALRCATMARRC